MIISSTSKAFTLPECQAETLLWKALFSLSRYTREYFPMESAQWTRDSADRHWLESSVSSRTHTANSIDQAVDYMILQRML